MAVFRARSFPFRPTPTPPAACPGDFRLSLADLRFPVSGFSPQFLLSTFCFKPPSGLTVPRRASRITGPPFHRFTETPDLPPPFNSLTRIWILRNEPNFPTEFRSFSLGARIVPIRSASPLPRAERTHDPKTRRNVASGPAVSYQPKRKSPWFPQGNQGLSQRFKMVEPRRLELLTF